MGTNRFSPTPNVPYFLALFLASPKKKGEKEGRRSNAAGLLFRELRLWKKREVVGLRPPLVFLDHVAERIGAEKPPPHYRPPDSSSRDTVRQCGTFKAANKNPQHHPTCVR